MNVEKRYILPELRELRCRNRHKLQRAVFKKSQDISPAKSAESSEEECSHGLPRQLVFVKASWSRFVFSLVDRRKTSHHKISPKVNNTVHLGRQPPQPLTRTTLPVTFKLLLG